MYVKTKQNKTVKPTTDHQTTNNQQPTTNNQQPTTNNNRHVNNKTVQ
jgi:hypothetical protein